MFLQQFFMVVESEEYDILVITELQPFVSLCFALFLTASIMADTQIHCNFINSTAFSIVLIFKSLWIKVSAKWLNVM